VIVQAVAQMIEQLGRGGAGFLFSINSQCIIEIESSPERLISQREVGTMLRARRRLPYLVSHPQLRAPVFYTVI
jgi:hypothetical protein